MSPDKQLLLRLRELRGVAKALTKPYRKGWGESDVAASTVIELSTWKERKFVEGFDRCLN